jgi:hypothetical protein
MKDKNTVKPSQNHTQKSSRIKPLMKILLFFAAAVGLGIALCAGFKIQKKDPVDLQAHLQPLQSKIQALQEKVRNLEDKISTMKPPVPAVVPATPPTESTVEFFLLERLIAEYYQNKPFKPYLEQLLALPALRSEKSEETAWLLSYGAEGAPSTGTLLALLKAVENRPEPSVPSIKFLEDPLAYLQNAFTWRSLFTLRSATRRETEKNLKALIKSKRFAEALSLMESSKNNNEPLKQALKSLLKSRTILSALETRLLKNFAKERHS